MEIKLGIGEDKTISIHGEDYYGYQRELGYDDFNLDKLTIAMSLDIFCGMTTEKIIEVQNWLKSNAGDKMRLRYMKEVDEQKRYEEERRQRREAEREERSKNKGKKIGYVYLVAADNGLHKIGKSINVTNRVNEFGIKLPVKTWLVHSFKSNQYDRAEIQLHEMFAEKRSHGEWFNLTEEDVKYICSIQDEQI